MHILIRFYGVHTETGTGGGIPEAVHVAILQGRDLCLVLPNVPDDPTLALLHKKGLPGSRGPLPNTMITNLGVPH